MVNHYLEDDPKEELKDVQFEARIAPHPDAPAAETLPAEIPCPAAVEAPKPKKEVKFVEDDFPELPPLPTLCNLPDHAVRDLGILLASSFIVGVGVSAIVMHFSRRVE